MTQRGFNWKDAQKSSNFLVSLCSSGDVIILCKCHLKFTLIPEEIERENAKKPFFMALRVDFKTKKVECNPN